MELSTLEKMIAVASGLKPADLVIKNCQIVDVFNQQIISGDLAITAGKIVGVGEKYSGIEEYDAKGKYVTPAFIEGHIHIESSYLSPEEFGRVVVPLGTGTVIADPHEIANVCGVQGVTYMLEAARHTVLDVQLMLPSCVPATCFEHNGAVLSAQEIETLLKREGVLGLGEMMNYTGVTKGDSEVLHKILAALKQGKVVDGHAPFLTGKALNAYATAGIHTDHECSTLAEMQERLRLGMYVQLRNGAACKNLVPLLAGVTTANFRRCLLCSDDIHPQNILQQGHINADVMTCIKEGIPPLQAITMATLNGAECYGMQDRGALAPSRRADICLWESLEDLTCPEMVWLEGVAVAEKGKYLPQVLPADITPVTNTMVVKDYSPEKLKLSLKTKQVRTIDIIPGEIITEQGQAEILLDAQGDFSYNPQEDLVKVAVIERHKGVGTVGLGLLRNFGLKRGAIAVTVAHDSHNIIVAGTNNSDMDVAVQRIIAMQGGIVLVVEGNSLAEMPLPIAGLMSNKRVEEVARTLADIHAKAHAVLGISKQVDPLMTLSFMALPVIPHLKLTDEGLFDVDKFSLVDMEIK